MITHRSHNLNVHGLTFLIADANSFVSSICQGILRGFGAGKVIEVRSANDALKALQQAKVDLLLCDANLPPAGGFELTHRIRSSEVSDYRTIPIVILTHDTRTTIISRARDCGANMVIAKPMSPNILYDRLAWVALTPRKFVDAPGYFGPDRRFKIEGFPNGIGRRKSDSVTEIGESAGPALGQSEIDNLFNAARSG